jgi:hypothetical protein
MQTSLYIGILYPCLHALAIIKYENFTPKTTRFLLKIATDNFTL